MRNLTIRRTNSFVGSMMQVKFYSPDPDGEVSVNRLRCRKLCTLKNGTEQRLSIGNEATIVFATIDDGLAKAVHSSQTVPDISQAIMDSITVPAGSTDVVVTGKNHFNVFRGNPFLFDHSS